LRGSAAGAPDGSPGRAVQAQLVVREQDKATRPRLRLPFAEDASDARSQGHSPRHTQTQQHQTVMRARRKLPDVGEIQILRYEKSLCRLCRLPDVGVSLAAHSFHAQSVRVMTESP